MDTVDNFNSTVKKLVILLYDNATKEEKKEGIERYKGMIFTALHIDPLIGVRRIGPYLLENKELIYSGDFLSMKVEELNGYIESRYKSDYEGKKIEELLDIARKMYARFENEKRETILKSVQTMLDIYVKYLYESST